MWITFSFIFLLSPLWMRKISLRCEKWDSRVFVVVGMFRWGYLRYVNRYGKLTVRLLIADLSLLCVKDHRPVVWSVVFSFKNSLYLTKYSFSKTVNSFSVVKGSSLTISSNSLPASNLGFLVTYLRMICFWWKWQNCTGIPLKTLIKPRNPSHVTDSIS